MLANYLVLFCLVSIATVQPAHADSKTITSEASYIMGDGESPSFAESMALQKAKQVALEEAGTYVESYTKTRNQDLTKDEVQTLAGGVLHVEVIEKTRTLIQDGLRVYLKIRATVTTDKMEELARRIRGKDLAEEYRDLQGKYDSLTQEVTRLKETLAKRPSGLERETVLNRIREQESSFTDIQKDETALFKKLISGEGLVAEARKVLRLSDTVINGMLKSNLDLRLMDLNPAIRGRSGLVELQIDASYQINDDLLKLIQQVATERGAVIEDVLLNRADLGLFPDNVSKPLLKAKLTKFQDTKENREELRFLQGDLSNLNVLVEVFSGKKLLGFCRFPHLRTQLVPGPKIEEKSFPENGSAVAGSDLTIDLISSPKYFGSETEYQDFRRLDASVERQLGSSLTKWKEAVERWELQQEKINQAPSKGKSQFRIETQMPDLGDYLPKDQRKRDALFQTAKTRWLDGHPSFIRIARTNPNFEKQIHSTSLITVNEKYVLAPQMGGMTGMDSPTLVPQKLVMTQQSLKQLTHATVRLIRASDVPALYQNDPFSLASISYDDCEAVAYRNGKRLHITKPGENLGSISRRYSITVEQLKKWNNLKESSIFPIDTQYYPTEGQSFIVGDE